MNRYHNMARGVLCFACLAALRLPSDSRGFVVGPRGLPAVPSDTAKDVATRAPLLSSTGGVRRNVAALHMVRDKDKDRKDERKREEEHLVSRLVSGVVRLSSLSVPRALLHVFSDAHVPENFDRMRRLNMGAEVKHVLSYRNDPMIQLVAASQALLSSSTPQAVCTVPVASLVACCFHRFARNPLGTAAYANVDPAPCGMFAPRFLHICRTDSVLL